MQGYHSFFTSTTFWFGAQYVGLCLNTNFMYVSFLTWGFTYSYSVFRELPFELVDCMDLSLVCDGWHVIVVFNQQVHVDTYSAERSSAAAPPVEKRAFSPVLRHGWFIGEMARLQKLHVWIVRLFAQVVCTCPPYVERGRGLDLKASSSKSQFGREVGKNSGTKSNFGHRMCIEA